LSFFFPTIRRDHNICCSHFQRLAIYQIKMNACEAAVP
jgi:hypothetical protein